MFTVQQIAPLDAESGVKQTVNISSSRSRSLTTAIQEEQKKIQELSSPLSLLSWVVIAAVAWKWLKQ
jgi:hypothetical protein